MRITFNTYRPVQFRGIDDALKKIKSQLNAGGIPTRDGFTPVQDGGTVIIENYYEGGKDKAEFSKLGNSRGSAAAEGAVSGATTGTAIEGTKSVVKKVKHSGEDVEKPHENALDADDASSVDLLGEEDKVVEAHNKTSDAGKTETVEDDTNIDTTDNVTDIDKEIDIDTELEPEIEVDHDIDVEPEIDDIGIDDIGIDVDIDAF